jgi:hypothetical protein
VWVWTSETTLSGLFHAWYGKNTVHRTVSPSFKKFIKWHEAYYFTYGASITAVNNVAQNMPKALSYEGETRETPRDHSRAPENLTEETWRFGFKLGWFQFLLKARTRLRCYYSSALLWRLRLHSINVFRSFLHSYPRQYPVLLPSDTIFWKYYSHICGFTEVSSLSNAVQ